MPTIQIINTPVQSGMISVPGFERLTVHGRVLDAANIYNPEQNACYFIVSVMLADGMEVFRSGILTPGQNVGIIELPNSITAGVYEHATARYSAFSIENLSPLNGADITFTLEVLP
jgi:hypothetical protein